MYISQFKIYNYKSYLDSGEIKLKPGINIITGKNNVGKTALLQALSLQFGNLPHKSSLNLKNRLSQNNNPSEVELIINSNTSDFQIYMFENFYQISLPDFTILPSYSNVTIGELQSLLLPNKNCLVRFNIKNGVAPEFISFNDFSSKGAMTVTYSKNDTDNFLRRTHSTNTKSSIFQQIISKQISRIYFFHAERLNISSHTHGTNRVLTPNASNLPEVLTNLLTNKSKFLRYVESVKKIFLQIQDV